MGFKVLNCKTGLSSWCGFWWVYTNDFGIGSNGQTLQAYFGVRWGSKVDSDQTIERSFTCSEHSNSPLNKIFLKSGSFTSSQHRRCSSVCGNSFTPLFFSSKCSRCQWALGIQRGQVINARKYGRAATICGRSQPHACTQIHVIGVGRPHSLIFCWPFLDHSLSAFGARSVFRFRCPEIVSSLR